MSKAHWPVSSSHSLPESYHTVSVPQKAGLFRKILAFGGPAFLISVGYMDPGNWATDLEAGSRFGSRLLWVILFSNCIAILLQNLSARLGLASGRDLARACRDFYPRWMVWPLWMLAEVGIIACDLAEVLGGAIGLHMLFRIPLIWGVAIMSLDVFILLFIQKLGFRFIEAAIIGFVAVIMSCYVVELFLVKPDWLGVARDALNPRLDGTCLYAAIGIIGATVMPHNLYLHSSIVQTRNVKPGPEGTRQAARFNFFDSLIALNFAFLVNAAIMVMADAVFHRRGLVITDFTEAQATLAPLLGTTLAGTVFAVALIFAGQSSTLTGTLAGQIVMEGFLDIRVKPWIRRVVTRLLALGPALFFVGTQDDAGSYKLLIISQVVLSLQLPFAVFPLVQFTSDPGKMRGLVSPPWLKLLAWMATAVIIILNMWLLSRFFGFGVANRA